VAQKTLLEKLGTDLGGMVLHNVVLFEGKKNENSFFFSGFLLFAGASKIKQSLGEKKKDFLKERVCRRVPA
jgi:hypothetical protein